MTGAMETTPTAMIAAMGRTPTAMSGSMESGTPSSGLSGDEMRWVTTTQDYSLTLRLGPLQQMLTPDQAQGATAGEVMVSGEMAMTGMGGRAANYHLELAVYDIKSGAVITDKSVVINLTSVSTGEQQTVPIAMMYDVHEGRSDTHFGNNVALAPGNYTVDVAVAGEKGTFNIPAQAMSATPSAMGTPGQMMMGITPTP